MVEVLDRRRFRLDGTSWPRCPIDVTASEEEVLVGQGLVELDWGPAAKDSGDKGRVGPAAGARDCADRTCRVGSEAELLTNAGETGLAPATRWRTRLVPSFVKVAATPKGTARGSM